MKTENYCQCIGVRCGAHPLGLCAKPGAKRYGFRLAATGQVLNDGSYRLYCDACAKGLNAAPYEPQRRKDKGNPQSLIENPGTGVL